VSREGGIGGDDGVDFFREEQGGEGFGVIWREVWGDFEGERGGSAVVLGEAILFFFEGAEEVSEGGFFL
jgi:hypothetical protein